MLTSNVGPTWPKSEFDHLEVNASGLKVGEADTATVTAICERLRVPGFAHTQGREANLTAFSRAREKVFNDAGRAAVQAWLARAS
jgi:hypothetical protein